MLRAGKTNPTIGTRIAGRKEVAIFKVKIMFINV